MQLITFHFAGGNKFSFNSLKKYMPASIDLVNLEFPGRIHQQDLTTDVHEIADHVYKEVIRHTGKPYAFFGHSMGTTIGYLVTKKLISAHLDLPVHLFVSGRLGPSFPFLKDGFHKLPKKDFLKGVKKLDGIPEEIYNSSAMDFFEPLLRADFAAIEGYKYENTKPFEIPITVFYGSREGIDERILDVSWQKETTIPVDVHRFSGGHFFIYDHWEEIAGIFKNKLENAYLIKN